MANTISNRQPAVSITYDSRGKRTSKEFDDAHAAKKFYAAKDRANKNPAVTSGELPPASNKADAPAKGKKETPKPVGVSESRTTRPFLAGQVLAKHGLEVGVTAAMIAELDVLVVTSGSRSGACPRESRFTLANTFHAIRGYEAAKS